MHGTSWSTFVYLPTNYTITRFTPNDLYLIFKVNILNRNISKKVRTSANIWNDFKYLAFYKHFSFLKCKWSLSCSCRFAFVCTAPAVELLLFVTLFTDEVLSLFNLIYLLTHSLGSAIHRWKVYFNTYSTVYYNISYGHFWPDM